MKIVIKTVPHSRQRYNTVGDWTVSRKGNLTICVSEFGDAFGEMCVAVHELVEVLLCLKRGISQQAVDKFDKEFEAKRKKGNFDEPGDSPSAPYHKEHLLATIVERILVAELGLNWKEYERKINSL